MGLFSEKNMAKQTINLGTAPTGAGGDTFRSTGTKTNANFTEVYNQLGADGAGALPTVLPIAKGGTGGASIDGAKSALGLGDTGIAGFSSNIIAQLYNVTTVSGFANVLGNAKLSSVSNGDWQQGNTSNTLNMPQRYGSLFGYIGNDSNGTYSWQIFRGYTGGALFFRYGAGTDTWAPWAVFRTGHNTTIDANGFLRNASPVCDMYVDHIELNDEAKLQTITFKRIGIGEYLISGSLGFAQEGWYIETPKDANGNVLFSVVYEQLENNDISVKTYKKKFDVETASIVPDLDKSVDITEGRFISLRLQELPHEVIEDDTEQ